MRKGLKGSPRRNLVRVANRYVNFHLSRDRDFGRPTRPFSGARARDGLIALATAVMLKPIFFFPARTARRAYRHPSLCGTFDGR